MFMLYQYALLSAGIFPGGNGRQKQRSHFIVKINNNNKVMITNNNRLFKSKIIAIKIQFRFFRF